MHADQHAVKVPLIGIDASEVRGKEGMQPFAQKAIASFQAWKKTVLQQQRGIWKIK